MPVMAIYRRDDIPAEVYEEFRRRAPLDSVPLGAISHSHAKVGRSGIISVDVWADRATLERYFQEVLVPVAGSLGVVLERPEIFDLETFVTTPNAAQYVVPFASEMA